MGNLVGMWLSWSGGKDAALALLEVGEVDGLVSTYDEATGRLPIHGVPLRLLEGQATALGLPLLAVPMPAPCPNTVYLARLDEALAGRAISELAFGDLHLEDIRAWRSSSLEALGVRARFPIFGRDAEALLDAAEAHRLEAIVCAVDRSRVDPSLLGRPFERATARALPPGCDPLGERGELHTLVTALGGRALVEEAPLPEPVALDGRHLALAWADR